LHDRIVNMPSLLLGDRIPRNENSLRLVLITFVIAVVSTWLAVPHVSGDERRDVDQFCVWVVSRSLPSVRPIAAGLQDHGLSWMQPVLASLRWRQLASPMIDSLKLLNANIVVRRNACAAGGIQYIEIPVLRRLHHDMASGTVYSQVSNNNPSCPITFPSVVGHQLK